MLEFYDGDILNENIPIMIPVNTVGTLGAGLAKQTRDRHPKLETLYKECLRNGTLKIGKPVIVMGGKFILFPTKEHWKNISQLSWIDEGFSNLINRDIVKLKKVAIPKLGCGLGQLEWPDVLLLIDLHFGKLDMEVRVYGEEISFSKLHLWQKNKKINPNISYNS